MDDRTTTPHPRHTAPAAARRVRQLAEIMALADRGATDRASDLSRLHLAEFPADAALLSDLGLP